MLTLPCYTIDVKMDWCNTRVNGAQLDPRIVYKNMVQTIIINTTTINSSFKCGY